ncbi:MAG: response regulator [Planctomycetota bacterium]|nr:response regulator [Planctomycetota bacterium]MEC8733833.1 response regulator [Planctomycetota bacterium]MEC9233823.1 response regulator [Planctomycetota bacterium]MED5508323.1 response regulator [Planctomycetota bacterium]
MADQHPRILLIGTDLEQAQRDRLEEYFEIVEVSRADQAIEELLHDQQGALAFGPGSVPGSDRVRELQVRVDEVDQVGGELLELDAERISPLDLAQRLHLLEERVSSGLLQLFGWRHFEVRLLDRETRKLELVISKGISPLPVGHVIHAELEHNGISGLVAASGRSYICRDSRGDRTYVHGMEGGRSSLTIPLRLHDRVIGILNVESPDPDRFNDEDRLLLELYGRYAAMAVNILDMLIVERYTTNMQLSSNVLSELESPIHRIEQEAREMIQEHDTDPVLVSHLESITESLAAMRARIQSCTSGPQTILGAEDVMHQEQLEPILAGRRVLVADDQAEVRQTIRAVLEQRGCEVVVSPSGTDAIERIGLEAESGTRFDLVISDVRMPDRNGYEVFRSAKDHDSEVPVILMTAFGYDPHHSIVRSSQEGLHCFLFKPFQAEQLLEEIYKALVLDAPGE